MADIPLERTLVILMPDAVARGLVGAILGRFEQAALAIIAAKLTRPSIEFARKHYPASDRQFEQMGSKTLETYRTLGLDPKERLGTDEAREIGKLIHEWNAEVMANLEKASIYNLVHASNNEADPSEAKREITYWFSESEIVPSRPAVARAMFKSPG